MCNLGDGDERARIRNHGDRCGRRFTGITDYPGGSARRGVIAGTSSNKNCEYGNRCRKSAHSQSLARRPLRSPSACVPQTTCAVTTASEPATAANDSVGSCQRQSSTVPTGTSSAAVAIVRNSSASAIWSLSVRAKFSAPRNAAGSRRAENATNPLVRGLVQWSRPASIR